MRLKELRQYLKGNKLVKHLTPNPKIDTGYFTNLVYDRETNCLAFIMREEGEPLTTTKVQEFIDASDNISDDALITVDNPCLVNNNNNLARWICEDDKVIAINEKASENVVEELIARSDSLQSMSDADFVQLAFDDGLTLEDFKKVSDNAYSFAKRTKEEFGLSELRP